MTAANLAKQALAAACLGLAVPAVTVAQGAADAPSPKTTAVAGSYKAGPITRALLGNNWRDVWVTPVAVPTLDIDTWNGGLQFKERGGGNQSMVLHLQAKDDWREYRFRSVNKFPGQGYPAFRGTAFGSLIQDQVSAYFPAAPLMVPPLLRSIGALTVDPALYVLGDSKELGVVRDTVVGMLGTFELKAEEAPDDKPGFAGATKIKGTEGFLEDLASSREHRLDEREFLAVRLLDMMINDPDRTPDNFDWARFGDKGAYTWRPLARDRDQAFIDSRGLLNRLLVSRVFPKQLPFTARYQLRGLTYSSHALDRRLLQRLTADDVRVIAERVRASVTDAAIAEAVAQLPAEWRATDADERLVSTLRARREGLPAFAMQFYRWLATEVDVHGTAEGDRVDVVRHADGRVTVTIGDAQRAATIARRDDGSVVTVSGGDVVREDATPYFQRTFLPQETNEVRVYAGDGDDVAVVRGAGSDAIVVRLLGGVGNDVLADSAGGSATVLYDEAGDNRFIPAAGTRIVTRPWKPVQQIVGFRGGSSWFPDWGSSRGFAPAFDFHTGAGLIVGGGPRWKQYGFRRMPHAWSAGADLLYGTLNGRLGAQGFLHVYAENAPRAFRLTGRATQLEATRFFGYGNATADIGSDAALVNQTVVAVEPSFVRFVGWRAREDTSNMIQSIRSNRYQGLRPTEGEFSLGASVAWFDADPGVTSPLARNGVAGAESFGMAGAKLALELDRTDDDAVPTSGWTLKADAAAYPLVTRLDNPFGTATARAAAYVPLGALGGPHLAFRLGGGVAAGDYPAQFAAALGGRSSLRGYSWRRFTGDAALNAGAELRVPLGTVNFLVRSQVGAFGLADAGRVWFDGASDGGWHRAFGGGLWASAFGRSFSVAYANGEGGRLYFKSGLSY